MHTSIRVMYLYLYVPCEKKNDWENRECEQANK